MSRKERTKIRRNNYRAWKQEQKQPKSAAPASSIAAAQSLEPAEQVAPPKAVAPFDPKAPLPVPPGALIPFNPKAPVNVVLLEQRLRFGGPEVTDEERIAIAHRLEQYAAMEAGDDVGPEEQEEFRKNMRSVLRDALRRFCIPWPPPGSSESATSASAPGHSTGPRTAAGKDRSSQNARTHGLSSPTSVFVLLPGEDVKEWVQLVDDLNGEFQPASRTERILVNDMAQSHWLTQRAINLQTNHIEDPKAFALFLRYQTTHHRAYYRALKQLQALQKARAQSGAPANPDHPALDFDAAVDLGDIGFGNTGLGNIDISSIPRPSNPASEPAPAGSVPSTESMTVPHAA
jgi:hypothetical protein